MKDLSAFIIPRTLDLPEKILFFTINEIVLIMLPTIFGILANHTIKGLIIGILMLFLSKKLKPTNNGYNINHLCYWYLPDWLFKTTILPPSHIRIFLG